MSRQEIFGDLPSFKKRRRRVNRRHCYSNGLECIDLVRLAFQSMTCIWQRIVQQQLLDSLTINASRMAFFVTSSSGVFVEDSNRLRNSVAILGSFESHRTLANSQATSKLASLWSFLALTIELMAT